MWANVDVEQHVRLLIAGMRCHRNLSFIENSSGTRELDEFRRVVSSHQVQTKLLTLEEEEHQENAMTQAFFTRTTRTQYQFSCREKICKYTRTQGRFLGRRSFVQIVAGSLRHCGAQLVRNMIGRHVLVPQNSSECSWVSSAACSLTCLFCFSLAALATDQEHRPHVPSILSSDVLSVLESGIDQPTPKSYACFFKAGRRSRVPF